MEEPGEARAQRLALPRERAAEHGAQQQVGADVLEEEEVGELALERVPAGPEQGRGRGEGQEQRGAALRAAHGDGGEAAAGTSASTAPRVGECPKARA